MNLTPPFGTHSPASNQSAEHIAADQQKNTGSLGPCWCHRRRAPLALGCAVLAAVSTLGLPQALALDRSPSPAPSCRPAASASSCPERGQLGLHKDTQTSLGVSRQSNTLRTEAHLNPFLVGYTSPLLAELHRLAESLASQMPSLLHSPGGMSPSVPSMTPTLVRPPATPNEVHWLDPHDSTELTW